MNREFSQWAQVYEEAVGEMARLTWASGIVAELVRMQRLNGSILDVGCGTGVGGRILKAIAPFRVVGLDRCAEMMERSNGIYDRIVQGDFSCFEIEDERFDFIVSGFDSLNYLSTDRLGSFFQSAQRVLKDGGRIIFDYSSPQLLYERWRDTTDRQRLSQGILDWTMRCPSPQDGCEIMLSWKDFAEHEVWREHHVQFTHDCYQIHALAQKVGLVVERIRNWNGEHFSPSVGTHVYVIGKGTA
jgi:ubiquinone/menaquinone biosynthesis C-methylase UbiE